MRPSNPEIIIIGAGPAGIAAAIQLKRYGLEPIVLEKDSIGGLLRNANLVENYPGFPSGISGGQLIKLFKQHIENIGVKVTYDEVFQLDYSDQWSAKTKRTTYQPAVVVIASGTKPKPIPIKIPVNAQTLVGSEVWSLFSAHGRRIVIIGAGDAAFDYALSLAGRRNSVTIFNRGNNPSCLPLLRERANENPKIFYLENIHLQRVDVDVSTKGLKLYTNQGTFDSDNLLFAIGREPMLDFLTENVKMQRRMLIESGKLHLVGDVHGDLFRQTAIATGEGVRVAMLIYANRGVYE
jgi:thioredoxin reductase (NADPH)